MGRLVPAPHSHQDFYLGPANDIRHGRYMLVDDYSQYGVAVIYFLAALLAPLPFGYGTLRARRSGILTALLFAAVYVVLRVATRSLAFAGLGTFVALHGEHDRDDRPLDAVPEHGIPALRHPLAARVRARRRLPRASGPHAAPLLVAYALVGVAAVWSFETAFYTGATFVVTVVAAAWTRPAGHAPALRRHPLGRGRRRPRRRHRGRSSSATVIGRGRGTGIGGYLDFLRLYSVDGFGQLPVPDWSLGYLMGGLYAASLVAVCPLAAVRRAAASSHAPRRSCRWPP